MNLVEEFKAYRAKMNEKIAASDDLIIKRIFNLDTHAYEKGALDVKSKVVIPHLRRAFEYWEELAHV